MCEYVCVYVCVCGGIFPFRCFGLKLLPSQSTTVALQMSSVHSITVCVRVCVLKEAFRCEVYI